MAMLEVLDERGWRWLGLEIRLEMVRIGDGSVRNTARWPLYIFRTRHGQQKWNWRNKNEARKKGDKRGGSFQGLLTKEFEIQKYLFFINWSSVVKMENGSTKTFIPSRSCS